MSGREGTTATIPRSHRSGPIGVVVRVVNRSSMPREYHLREGACVLGAGAASDVVIDDETVSRTHAEIELVPEGVAVRDLGSHNGTHYLGQRIERAVLSVGSTFHCGHAQIRIEPDRELFSSPDLPILDSYGALAGSSRAMRELFGVLTRLEGSLVGVLIQGASGTGKELIARAIHQHSAIGNGPFVAVNCGAMERSLVRSELFGHRRGAFTGALEGRVGSFEHASGGTLFLDEVGELPLDVQPVLLRALEVGSITRLGENDERPVKVRLIAATNRDLTAEVRAGRFREDLFFRLAVVQLKVPPLRERPEDVPILARHLAAEAGLAALSDDLIEELARRPWPGNVREMKNAIHAYAALGALPPYQSIRENEFDDTLARAIDLGVPYADQKRRLLRRFQRRYVEALLLHTKGNQSHAARISGIDRGHLNRVIAQLKNGELADDLE